MEEIFFNKSVAILLKNWQNMLKLFLFSRHEPASKFFFIFISSDISQKPLSGSVEHNIVRVPLFYYKNNLNFNLAFLAFFHSFIFSFFKIKKSTTIIKKIHEIHVYRHNNSDESGLTEKDQNSY